MNGLNKGLVFDLDNTLYETPQSDFGWWANAFWGACQEFKLPIDFETCCAKKNEGFKKYSNAIRIFHLEYHVNEHDFFDCVVRHMDLTEIQPCAVTQSLFEKNKSHQMGILSSGARGWADPLLCHLKLDHFFDPRHVLTYHDTKGHLKATSPEPFQMIAERMIRPLNALVMIEDSSENLVIAHDLGMKTVLVTHGKVQNTTPSHIDFTIDKAYHVFDLIEQGEL